MPGRVRHREEPVDERREGEPDDEDQDRDLVSDVSSFDQAVDRSG